MVSQYAMMLNWLDIEGETLLRMEQDERLALGHN